jgi:hypothetical protein
MNKIQKNDKIITDIIFKATAELQLEIEKELMIETPDLEKAKAIINENSSRNDSGLSSEDNTESL